jgi:hypothetical protein
VHNIAGEDHLAFEEGMYAQEILRVIKAIVQRFAQFVQARSFFEHQFLQIEYNLD